MVERTRKKRCERKGTGTVEAKQSIARLPKTYLHFRPATQRRSRPLTSVPRRKLEVDGGDERLLAGLGEDALAGIRDEASGDDVRIAGSDRGHEAARGSRIGGVWDCRRVVPKHRTRPVGKNIESGRERRDVRSPSHASSQVCVAPTDARTPSTHDTTNPSGHSMAARRDFSPA